MIRPDASDEIGTEHGVDTDHDGLPDTVVLSDPVDLLLAVDVDRDQLADLVVRIGPDGTSSTVELDQLPWLPTDPSAQLCSDPFWTGL
jgi:hypothetical protein